MSSTAVARAVVDTLLARGVEHVVLAPGSRSAPLAFALHAAQDRLTLHTRIDERSAAFLALGISKTSRKHVAVVTTSGTATANLHPAVLEAHHAGVRLIAVTADRPAALRGTNANQTTNQVELYGGAVDLFVDVAAGDVKGAVEAVTRALMQRGPSHLNLQFEEPLVPPGEGFDGAQRQEHGRADASERFEISEEASAIDWDDKPTVVVAGDDAGMRARVLAEQHGWPLFAEPSSGSRTGTHAIRAYRLLLADPALADRIQRVFVCGHPTLSRPITRLISRKDLEVIGVPGPLGVTDPGRVITRTIELGQPDDRPRISSPWLEEWLARDASVSDKLDAFLDASDELLPHLVARAVARALPDEGLLVVGASNPVRDLDLVVPRYRVGGRRMVIANRGLAGIDGTISTAVGAALGRPRSSRAFALLGDVTFLHDTNGLQIGPGEQRPDLMIVVVNDDGGSIFASLEQGAPEYADSFEKLFGTPHGVDLSALCAAHGVPHREVTTADELEAALATPQGGVEVVEAKVSRASRRDLDATIRGLV
ncbi:MAG TPA: 2-succinyl-5-enolpyruvyl-6-hydroxy-3-cyclohexene-1-carboxylic-acid synthase [Nocardioidaceae bacterium]|nr:2-succinyl-5-enolpyruvyl-6-hydroxy-3-cyclohexene-1-carboxylic-acid synthase [Nocardioidaceae bacterium]